MLDIVSICIKTPDFSAGYAYLVANANIEMLNVCTYVCL